MNVDGEKVKFNYNFGTPSCVPISTYESAADEIDVEGIKSLLADCSVKKIGVKRKNMAKSIKKNQLKDHIRDIPDFPKEGIIFKDITTLLQDRDAFKKSIDLMAKKFKNEDIDLVIGVEARGFIFGAALAYKLRKGFVTVRKKGKLPYKTKSVTYELEYGSDELEIHEDALPKGSRVLIVDDLLATGGTIKAVTDLVESQEAVIAGLTFLVELKFLKGKEKLKGLPVYSILKY